MNRLDLTRHGIGSAAALRNATTTELYEYALAHETGTAIADSGALIAFSGERTGRSPRDKRIVDRPEIHDEVWWGKVNVGLDPDAFDRLRAHAAAHLDGLDHVHVVDGFAGWDPRYRVRIRL